MYLCNLIHENLFKEVGFILPMKQLGFGMRYVCQGELVALGCLNSILHSGFAFRFLPLGLIQTMN